VRSCGGNRQPCSTSHCALETRTAQVALRASYFNGQSLGLQGSSCRLSDSDLVVTGDEGGNVRVPFAQVQVG